MNRREIIKLGGVAWIAPVVMSVTLPAHAQTSGEIDIRGGGDPRSCTGDDCESECPIEWSKSSFTFTDGAIVCNRGDGISLCPIAYVVIRFVKVQQGGQASELILESGFIEPLGEAGCHDFTALKQRTASPYDKTCIRVYQDDGHPGIGYTSYCY